jgi:hypothetical protein
MSDPSAPSRELFLAELEHFEESIWKNEEIGEKRFNFFVTLATAVAGGLVALWANDKLSEDIRDQLPALTGQACLALLIFGLVSYFRMLHRDRVTDEYKDTTSYIRNRYLQEFRDQDKAPLVYELPLEKLKASRKGESEWKKQLRRIVQGGYAPTLGVMNSVLLVSVLMWTSHMNRTPATAFGVLLFLVLWLSGIWLNKKPDVKPVQNT